MHNKKNLYDSKGWEEIRVFDMKILFKFDGFDGNDIFSLYWLYFSKEAFSSCFSIVIEKLCT